MQGLWDGWVFVSGEQEDIVSWAQGSWGDWKGFWGAWGDQKRLPQWCCVVCSDAVVNAEPVAGLSVNVSLCSGSGDASVSFSLLLFGPRMSLALSRPHGASRQGLAPATASK